MKVKATIHIESMKKFYVGELDKAEFDLILQLGSSSTVKLLQNSIDTTKKETKKKKGLGIIVVSAQKKNAEVESVAVKRKPCIDNLTLLDVVAKN